MAVQALMNDVGILAVKPHRVTDVGAWHGHIPFAFWIVHTLKPATLVELGVHKGDSYSAFCQAVDMFALPTKCFGVDTWKGDDHAEFYEEAVYQELCAYHEPRYSRFSRLLRMRFDEALAYFSDGSVDLLHVDGRHGYEDVKDDFESWVPKLSERAVVLFHDINVRERGFGVWKYFEEVATRFPGRTFSFEHCNGLGVLAWGEQVPDAIRQLCAASGDEARNLKVLFGSFGELISVRAENAKRVVEQGALTAEKGQLAAALQAEKEHAGTVQQMNDTLLNSYSFRLTQPLRSVARMARRLGGR